MFSKEQFTTVTPLSKAIAMALFILLPFVFFIAGHWYGQLGIVPTSVKETAKNEGVDEHERSVSNRIYSIESIGLDFTLPSGWTADTIIIAGENGGKNYTFSKIKNDLSVVVTISGLNRGWSECEDYEIDDSERNIKILIAETVPAYDKYYIVGHKIIGANIDAYKYKGKLFISNSSDSNWYDSLQATYNGNRTATADLKVDEVYATCGVAPQNGLALTSPVEAWSEGQFFYYNRISIKSASNNIVEHMESNSSELREVLSILKSITPSR